MGLALVRENGEAAPLQAEDLPLPALLAHVARHLGLREALVAAPVVAPDHPHRAIGLLVLLEGARRDPVPAQGAHHRPHRALGAAVHLDEPGLELGVDPAPERARLEAAGAVLVEVVPHVHEPHRLAALVRAPDEALLAPVHHVAPHPAVLQSRVAALVRALNQPLRALLPLVPVPVPGHQTLHPARVAARDDSHVAGLLLVMVPQPSRHREAAADPAPHRPRRALVPQVVPHVPLTDLGVAHEVALDEPVRALGRQVQTLVPEAHREAAPEPAVHGPQLARVLHVRGHGGPLLARPAAERAVDGAHGAELHLVLDLLPRLQQVHVAALVRATHGSLRALARLVGHEARPVVQQAAPPAARHLGHRRPAPGYHEAEVALLELEHHRDGLLVLGRLGPVQRGLPLAVLHAQVRPGLEQEPHAPVLP
mmetsp:Transcript_10440/g.24232  ORF Transcript_10440/g.24232 Transcript_10440/m.24232 type:complete len:425 (-) Transcript_10440:400-1674(-)